MRAKLSLNQIKQLETELSSRYTKAEVDAIILGVENNFNGDLSTLQAAVEQEILAIKGRLDTAESTLSSHTNAIDSLGTQISDEAGYRLSGDQTNAAAISAETTRATTAEQALDARVSVLESTDTAYDTRLDALEIGLADEVTTRTSNDTYLQGQITSLQNEIPTINSNINQEITNRVAADQNLQNQIDALNSEASGSVGALETRMDAVELKNTEQDGRLTTLESDLAEVEAAVMLKSSIVQQSFVATAGQTVFSLAEPVASVFIAMVMVNGVQYLLGTDFTMSGSSLTFTSGLEANDEVQATYFNK